MSQYMMDGGHRWMQNCDECHGWHHCSMPVDKYSDHDWKCPTCRRKDAEIATLKAERDEAYSRGLLAAINVCARLRLTASQSAADALSHAIVNIGDLNGST